MNRNELLELERLADADLPQIRATHPELFKTLNSKVGSARQQVLLSQFSSASGALRDRLRRSSFSLEGDQSFQTQVANAVGGEGTSPELLNEAASRLVELQQAGTLVDPANLNVPIREHPLFQQELQTARVLRLAENLRLPDDRAGRLIARFSEPAAITEAALEEAVAGRMLNDVEARTLGLSATLYSLADDQPALAEAIRKVGRVEHLEDLARLDADAWLKAIRGSATSSAFGEKPEEWASRLIATTLALVPEQVLAAHATPKTVALASVSQLAQLNPALRLEELLASDASDADKERVANTRIGLVAKVRDQNPTLNLLALDYTPDSDDLKSLQLAGLAEDEQKMVVANLKAQQRVFGLTEDVDHTLKLMSAGYHSANKIAAVDANHLAKQTGLDLTVATRIKADAENRLAAVTSVSGALLDLMRGFGRLSTGNVMPTVEDYLKKIPGYADLFGSQDYCSCEHCQSILGPAAYFVDLMKFIEVNVLDKVFVGALATSVLHLKSRRPDLWTLPLTCENTNTLIAYLDIINPVLENYIAKRRGYTGSLDDRKAVQTAVYEQAIATAVDSFKQPFLLPLARVDEYLKLAGSSRGEVARGIGSSAAVQTSAVLGLSDAERALIVQPNITDAFLRRVYGLNFTVQASGQVDPVNARDLVRFTSLTREELGDLAASVFVSPGAAQSVDIRAEKSSPASVQNDIERVHRLTLTNLDALHRLTRLWRRLGWTVQEVDLALMQLSAAGLTTGIDATALEHLAAMVGWRERWGAGIDELCALFGSVPTRPLAPNRPSLFDRAFNLPAFVQRDGALPMPTVDFTHPAFRTTGLSQPDDNTLHRLMAGLRLSDDQLAVLIRKLATPLGANLNDANENNRGFKLTDGNLTLLFRHAKLASLLRLSIDALFQALALSGSTTGHVATMAELAAFLAFYDWWRESGYTLDRLGTIIHGPVLNTATLPVSADLATSVVESIGADHALEFADLVFAFVPGVTEEQSRELIEANIARLEPLAASYRLASSLNPALPLTVPASVTVAEPDLRAKLMEYHAEAAVTSRLALRLATPVDVMRELITMTGVNLTQAALVDAAKGAGNAPIVSLIDRLVPLVAMFKSRAFDAQALAWTRQNAAAFAITDFNALTLQEVRALNAYEATVEVGLARAEAFNAQYQAQDLQNVLSSFSAATHFDAVDQTALARALGSDVSTLAVVRPNVPLSAAAPAALLTLRQGVSLTQKLGVGGDTLGRILATAYSDIEKAADALLGASRARFASEEEWSKALDPYEDRLRSKRRDALADHLIRSVHPEFETLNDLYQYFLLDVQLGGCARTTKLVAAISSAQVYVHRCLMNLEINRRAANDPLFVHVEPTLVPAEEWQWRKNYRVWEANRKVFLFPENYIEPELRDDKTPLFTELESTLLQQQISSQNALDAYSQYLSGFEEIGRLKIAGAYHHRPEGAREDVLHLIGVTASDPPVFYHRTIENAYHGEIGGTRGIVYGAWQKIEVSIPVQKVSPVVFLDRLFLFWVEITTSSKNRVTDEGSQFTGYQHKLAARFVMLRLDGKWTQPQPVALLGSVFGNGDGIVADPLASKAELDALAAAVSSFNVSAMATAISRMTTPQFDSVAHPEPIDSYTLRGFNWDTLYPQPSSSALRLTGRNFVMRGNVDFYNRTLGSLASLNVHTPATPRVLCARQSGGKLTLYAGHSSLFVLDDFAQATLVADDRRLSAFERTGEMSFLLPLLKMGLYTQTLATNLRTSDEISIINGLTEDAIIDSGGDLLLLQGSVRPGAKYLIKRLSTTLGETLARTLFVGGIDLLLDTKSQVALAERPLPLTLGSWIENGGNAGRVDFVGSLGTYFREIYFHVPFLIANHLNSQQQFAAAQRWYHYIFDPTADEPLPPAWLPAAWREKLERNRVWRYREFRNLDVPKLREILTDPAAIEVYKKDPFNPHAIARLRLSAYQKSIVMKYVDNLLDWADTLFARFTMESVQEATMLYVMALDVLGERPAALGSCGEGAVTPRTYEKIGPLIDEESEFLIELESWVFAGTKAVNTSLKQKSFTRVFDKSTKVLAERKAQSKRAPTLRILAAPALQLDETLAVGVSREALAAPTLSSVFAKQVVDLPLGLPPRAAQEMSQPSTSPLAVRAADIAIAGRPWNTTRIGTWESGPGPQLRPGRVVDSPLFGGEHRVPGFGRAFLRQLKPIFCVPMNKELLALWDRTEDRLRKIRNCLDINGVRRDLAPFAPEIDPRLLVRARAAGLAIDDVLGAASGNLPPYRFTFLIERARAHTAAVQGFGAALLSAIEKRDAEELNRLRMTHQQNLLKLTSRVREWEITIATDGIAQLERQRAGVTYRRDYFQSMVDNGLTQWESAQQIARHTASVLNGVAAVQQIVAGVGYLIPQLGSPFAMKYGGVELGNSAQAFAHVTKNLTAVAEAVSASAGLEAGFDRRAEGWEHQVELANHELKVLDKQLSTAQLRKQIAVRGLELHQKSLDQNEEVLKFHQDRFSNLGLYTWLATTLQRTYREAYNGAFAMARLAEQAYRFERNDDTTPLLSDDYWDAQKGGLLAGERLAAELLNLERRFYETNYRPLEIDQPFSLGQIDPAALIQLRETGSCDFEIAEVFFDLFYPGQYRRRARSVRLTIPCITGPYTNVSATLTLTGSRIRLEPKLGPGLLLDVPPRRSVSIATSTAQSDAGIFEFSFRDERYLPFEGAGAVSRWRLALPAAFRPFDYQTINDVIVHISYSAEEDGAFRAAVEQQNAATQGTILQYLASTPIARAFSFRQDFSGSLARLWHGAVNTPVRIDVQEKHVPLILRGRTLQVVSATLLLRTPPAQTLGAAQLTLNGSAVGAFVRRPTLGNLWGADVTARFAAGLFGSYTLAVMTAGDLAPVAPPPGDQSALDEAKLGDVILYIEYQLV